MNSRAYLIPLSSTRNRLELISPDTWGQSDCRTEAQALWWEREDWNKPGLRALLSPWGKK